MPITQIGDGQWDFTDHDGSETRLPPDTVANVSFPTSWRVYGPVAADNTTIDWARKENYMWYKEAIPAADAAVENLGDIPDSLKVGVESFEGRVVSMDGDTLDFSVTFGGHEAGQQAYAITEMEVDKKTEVIFGAGCDWWMQWWIDGKPIYDTIQRGNRIGFPWSKTSQNSVIKRSNHCFRQTLNPGKHLIVVRTFSGELSWLLRTGFVSPRDEFFHSLPYTNQWEFLPDLDEIHSPSFRPNKEYWHHTMAIRTDLCLADETLECEYIQLDHSGNFGFIFGAQDNDHYYWCHIPDWGQLFRARAFYAAISIADGTGYHRNLKMELMHNVQMHVNMWHTMKVERRGKQIQMWIDGVKGPGVIDDTYGAGKVGIGGFSRYQIRNLKIDGKPADAATWVKDDSRGIPWVEPATDYKPGDHHWLGAPFQFSDGEILLPIEITYDDISTHRKNTDNMEVYLYHSLDYGKSWESYGGPLLKNGPGLWFESRPGVIRSFEPMWTGPKKAVVLRESLDKGLTWTEVGTGQLMGDWDRNLFQEGSGNDLCGWTRLRDGTLLMEMMHTPNPLQEGQAPGPNMGMATWGVGLWQPYVSRSTDDGLTWSEPVQMDHATDRLGDELQSPIGDLTETAIAELPGGRIVALARPHKSATMWQTHSDDGGRSWSIACRAPFSGAGGPQMVATTSGYLAIVKRGPGLGLHTSMDGGINWDEGTMIDYTTSYNGGLLEVEPDVLLVSTPLAFDEIRPAPSRTYWIRLTPDGPVPADIS